jgi:GDPmannose 4,6-dehydratase
MAGVEIEFSGSGKNEKACISGFNTLPEGAQLNESSIGKCVIEVDPDYFRPTEVDLLIGDATKAFEKLGWKPEYNLEMLVKEMIDSDLRSMRRERALQEMGHDVKRYFE